MELLPSHHNQHSQQPQLLLAPYQQNHIKQIKKQLKSSFPLIKSVESASTIQNICQPAPISSFKPIISFQSQVSLDSEISHQSDFTPKKSEQNRSQADHSYEVKGMHESCVSKSLQNSIDEKTNENMIKFLEYLVAFKTKKLEQQKTFNDQQDIELQLEINISYQQKEESDSLLRLTARSTKISQTLRQTSKDINSEINSLQNLHHNYKCDVCDMTPICGPRYHCNCCQDYDECQECHKKKLHNHPLQAITKPGKCRQLEKVVNLLKKPNISNSSLAVTRRGKENMKELSINRSTHC